MNTTAHTDYTVAIRTLGKDPETLRRELESIYAQTILPDDVLIFIAKGYDIPPFRVGNEKYIVCEKGMVRQRAQDYSNVTSPYILLLDDDVVLAPVSVERLMRAMQGNDLDCISPDTFATHKMPLKVKVHAALTNMDLPHYSQKHAFKIRSNGANSYIGNPVKDIYLSQSAAGPCSLWRKEALIRTHLEEECWLDDMGFAYNDDGLEFYKLYINGGRLGIHFDAGVKHVEAKTASSVYRNAKDKFHTRAKAQYILWYRMIYNTRRGAWSKGLSAVSYALKLAWMLPSHIVAMVVCRNPKAPVQLVTGTISGIKYTRTDMFKSLPPYKK